MGSHGCPLSCRVNVRKFEKFVKLAKILIERESNAYILFGNTYANMTYEDLTGVELNDLDVYLAVDKFIHPDYNKNANLDVALIRLKSPIEATPSGHTVSENNVCLPEMSKVVDKELNEYAMLLGWALPGSDKGLRLGYTKINSFDGDFNYIVLTKKLDNIQLCKV
jgi:hypothetical protein